MKKILIIGKKSFLGSNLTIYLSKYYNVDNFSFNKALKKKSNFFSQYSYIINTTIHPNYVKKKYQPLFDLDKKFINKFNHGALKLNFTYIFLSSRKIYKKNECINEKSLIQPVCNYSKNKRNTEIFLKKKLKKNLLILRISNILGKRIFLKSRKAHKLFLDNYIDYRKSKKKIIVKDDFKDFLSINQFSIIIKKIIKFNLNGVYNVSLGKKIYISEILSWLDKKFLKHVEFKEGTNKDSFTLSNEKLIKKLKIKITKNQLKNFCKKLI